MKVKTQVVTENQFEHEKKNSSWFSSNNRVTPSGQQLTFITKWRKGKKSQIGEPFRVNINELCVFSSYDCFFRDYVGTC